MAISHDFPLPSETLEEIKRRNASGKRYTAGGVGGKEVPRKTREDRRKLPLPSMRSVATDSRKRSTTSCPVDLLSRVKKDERITVRVGGGSSRREHLKKGAVEGGKKKLAWD